MNYLACITNDLPDVRSCTIRDAHTANCDREKCAGCAPREASHGLLCEGCWHRLEESDQDWGDWYRLLGKEARAYTPDRIGSAKGGPRIPLTGMQIGIEQTLRTLSRKPARLDLWVASMTGAADAVRFARAAHNTMEHNPTTEQEVKLTVARCPRCRLSGHLVREPAQYLGDEPVIRCLRTSCGYVADETDYDLITMQEESCCRVCRPREEGERCDLTCTCHLSAPVPSWARTTHGEFETYDPNRPEHRELTA